MLKTLFHGLPRGKTILFFCLLIISATLTYRNHFHNSFHFDDSHTIENNAFIRYTRNIPLFFKDGTTFSSLPANQSYRPIVSTSLAIDYRLGHGYDTFWFHLSTFILFLLQGLVLFFVIFRILQLSWPTGWNFYIAAVAVTWYTLHPANAETVNYIIARSDIQSTFFVILGLALYAGSPFCRRTWLYLLPIVIGALAKPPAVMFAPILFFYILLFEESQGLSHLHQKDGRIHLYSALKKSLPAFIVCALSYAFVSYMTPPSWDPGNISRIDYMMTQPYVILHYFITFFLPFWLSADTDWQLEHGINMHFATGSAFVIVMILIAIWFSKSQKLRPVTFGIAWFFLALIPTSSVIPLSEVLNDHRIFFPYVGLTISVCWIAGLLLKKHYERSLRKKRYLALTWSVVLMLLGGYAYGVHERNKVWASEETLWEDVTVKSPQNARGLMNYGLAKMSKGDYAAAERYYLQALKMWPQYSFLHVNLGILNQVKGDDKTAEMYFSNGITYGSGLPDAWYFYGKYLSEKGRYPEAAGMFEHALALSPAHAGARSLLMKSYLEMENWEKLQALAESTLATMPGDPESLSYLDAAKLRKGKTEIALEAVLTAPTAEKYLSLSLAYYQGGNYNKCIEASLEALKIQPSYAEAYNNIGAAYLAMKEYDKAIAACKKALEIKPDYQLAKNNLAEALKQHDAEKTQQQAISRHPTPEAYLDLSLQMYQQGRYLECIAACENALKLRPDYADAYSNIGAAYNQLKQWDKAIEACKKALAIDPSHKLANGNLKWAMDEKSKAGN